jgi:hypothetical protein
VNRDELRKRAEVLVSPRTRLLAIVTGCVSAVAGSLPVGPLFAVLPAILIFGAVLQRWSPRPGRWLMWLGAFFLTLDVGGFFIRQSFDRHISLTPPKLLSFCFLSYLLGWSAGVTWLSSLIHVSPRTCRLDGPRIPRTSGLDNWNSCDFSYGMAGGSQGTL